MLPPSPACAAFINAFHLICRYLSLAYHNPCSLSKKCILISWWRCTFNRYLIFSFWFIYKSEEASWFRSCKTSTFYITFAASRLSFSGFSILYRLSFFSDIFYDVSSHISLNSVNLCESFYFSSSFRTLRSCLFFLSHHMPDVFYPIQVKVSSSQEQPFAVPLTYWLKNSDMLSMGPFPPFLLYSSHLMKLWF